MARKPSGIGGGGGVMTGLWRMRSAEERRKKVECWIVFGRFRLSTKTNSILNRLIISVT